MEETRDTIEFTNGSQINCIPTSTTIRGNRSKLIGLYDDKMTDQEKKNLIKYFKTHPEYYAEMVTGVKLPLYQRIFIKLLYKIKS